MVYTLLSNDLSLHAPEGVTAVQHADNVQVKLRYKWQEAGC